MNRPIHITFISKRIENEFEYLKQGKFEDLKLYGFIERAIRDLKTNPMCGIKIPKRLWPKDYILKYQITNLWKYDLPNGWRLLYTIQTTEVLILNVILEWLDHKNYERRFRY